MDEAEAILLRSLENAGVSLAKGVLSIQDLTSDSLFSICSQSLSLIDSSSSFPTSLPASSSVADRFKICTDISSAIKTLGYAGDLSFHQFLYPSDEDSRKLVRFLVERLSHTSEGQLTGVVTRERFLGNEAVRDKGKEGADNLSVDQNNQTLTFRMESSRPRNEKTQSGENAAPSITQQAKPRLHIDPSMVEFNNIQTLKAGLPRSSDFLTEEVTEHQLLHAHLVPRQTYGLAMAEVSNSESSKSSQNVETRMDEDINELSEESDKLTKETFVGGKSVVQRDGRYITELKQKLESLREQSAKIRLEIEDVKRQNKMQAEELTEKTLDVRSLEDEQVPLKEAVEKALDDENPGEFYLEEINNQVQARRNNLGEMESEWNSSVTGTFKQLLEKKKISLQRPFQEQESGGQERFLQLEKVELERKAIASEILKRGEEHSKLSAELENLPNIASRKSYIQRITEITKNSRKQDADIDRILQETRQLQIESNSIQDRLHRTYTVVDETIFSSLGNTLHYQHAEASMIKEILLYCFPFQLR
eukprot:TRINITY_DN10366_c0_g2_i7.p1 TRINITY_DN10366_c0_g2~~TRINITY_DN10366_c0_g2_i7.p1  ORF type:complete len:535 (+),score=132.85 TRINITY_DN10366_c0_g2_i7:267-1871(+)